MIYLKKQIKDCVFCTTYFYIFGGFLERGHWLKIYASLQTNFFRAKSRVYPIKIRYYSTH